jgi:hypothetical protein
MKNISHIVLYIKKHATDFSCDQAQATAAERAAEITRQAAQQGRTAEAKAAAERLTTAEAPCPEGSQRSMKIAIR